MKELPKCYTVLFNAVRDAITALENQDSTQAMALLIHGQLEAEEAYINNNE